jgi:CheY-like chemotaxis protein
VISPYRKCILHVEDHVDTCELVSLLLEDYKVISAHNMAEAIGLLTFEKFDLVVLDYHLPDGTGLDICRFIRSFDYKTPILFFTGTSSLDKVRATAVGAQGVLGKRGGFTNKIILAVNQILGQA